MASSLLDNRKKSSLNQSASLILRQEPFDPTGLIYTGAAISGWFAARNLSASNGTVVDPWPDRSNFGASRDLDIENSASANKPKFNSTFRAGMPAIEFLSSSSGGSNERYAATKTYSGNADSYLIKDNFSIYVICNATALTSAGATWEDGSNIANSLLTNGGGLRTLALGFATLGGVLHVGFAINNASAARVKLTTPYTLNTIVLIEIIHRAGTLIFNVAGVEQTIALTPADFNQNLIVGGDTGDIKYVGKLGELITFRGALTDPDRTSLKVALNAQYNL